MAVSGNANILAMLKVYYKDGIENLLFRNSPVLKEITKTRVEGKSANFSAMYGRGGAVGADFTKAKAAAATVAKATEFAVTPGQLFSVYDINAKEVQASLTNAGAYMRVAGAKMFACTDAFRKTMAACLYGTGYGELAVLEAATVTANTEFDIELPSHARLAIDVGSKLDVKPTIDSASIRGTLEVKSIKKDKISVVSGTSFTILATDYACLHGSMDASGSPLLPTGLEAWLPTIGDREGSTWETYIEKPFFGVNRSISENALAGGFVLQGASDTIDQTIQNGISLAREQGSVADMIVMNDKTFMKFAKEVQASSTYYVQTGSKEKRTANTGTSEFTSSFSTNYIENIIDDPFCPENRIYILDSKGIELWSYTNVEKLNDGVVGNNPGKADIMDTDGKEASPYALIIDDYLNVAPGADSIDGPSTMVTLQYFGSLAVTNPSVHVVCKLI